MTIAFTDPTTVPILANCLQSCPKLHTLCIVYAYPKATSLLKSSFQGKRFERLRAIILPTRAHNVLRACPNVDTVVCNKDAGGTIVTTIGRCCKYVQVLHGIRAERAIMERNVTIYS